MGKPTELVDIQKTEGFFRRSEAHGQNKFDFLKALG